MTPRSPGRPRDPSVDERVLEATMSLLVEHGFDGLRVDQVSRTSGVPKSTIYRRWPSLKLLAVDAVDRAIEPNRFTPSDDIVADLERLIATAHAALVDEPLSRVIPQLGMDLADTPDILVEYRRRTTEPLRRAAIDTIERGSAAGLWTVDDPTRVVNLFIGGLIYRSTYLGETQTLAESYRAIDWLTRSSTFGAAAGAGRD
jgi:AcrR family transcriptional regulator